MLIRCLVVLLLLTGVAVAQSQQPSSQTGQQNATQQERGSDKSPVVVKILPTEKSKDDLAREDAKDKEKFAIEERLVSLTGDLALYTKLLFIATAILALITSGLVAVGFFQINDMKESIRSAGKSAAAAEKSADVAEKSIRPWVGIDGPIEVTSPLVFDKEGAKIFVRFHLKNGGNSAARGAVTIGILVVGPPPLPHIAQGMQAKIPHADLENMTKTFGNLILPGAEFASDRPALHFNEIQNFNLPAKKEDTHVWLTGWVAYRDAANVLHKTGFVQVYIAKDGRQTFAPEGTIKGHFSITGVGGYAD